MRIVQISGAYQQNPKDFKLGLGLYFLSTVIRMSVKYVILPKSTFASPYVQMHFEARSKKLLQPNCSNAFDVNSLHTDPLLLVSSGFSFSELEN